MLGSDRPEKTAGEDGASHVEVRDVLYREVYYPRVRLSDEARLVLTSLADGPKHGYAIAQDVEGFARRKLGAGTLYGAIARLESSGLIEALPGDARRRPYRVTARGRRALTESVEEAHRIVVAARRRLLPR